MNRPDRAEPVEQPERGDGDGADDGAEASEPSSRWEARPRRLLANVGDLRRRLGQRREQQIDVVLAEQRVVASSTVEQAVVGRITIESIERGVSTLGSVSFAWEGECRRCLDLVAGTLDVEIDEIFQVGAPPDSDIIDFDGDQIDLIPVLNDAVALSLPLAPLCGDDCTGPDPDRYPTVTADEHEQTRAEELEELGPDPRWAALDDLDLS